MNNLSRFLASAAAAAAALRSTAGGAAGTSSAAAGLGGAAPMARLVLGNEAADLDSVACALVYAMHLSHMHKELHIPVINLARDELVYRGEVGHVLHRLAVSPENHLVFAPDLPLQDLHAAGRLELTLVDHNRMAEAQRSLAPAVRRVLDHHDQDGTFPNAAHVTIEPVGSCASLVARQVLSEAPESLDAATAELLLTTILLDTINLDPTKSRGTAVDTEMADKLRAIVGTAAHSLYEGAHAAKFEIGHLTTRQLLSRDSKTVELPPLVASVPSIACNLSDFFARPDAVDTLREWMEEQKATFVAIMALQQEPTFRRQLALYTTPSLTDSQWFARVCDALAASELQLKPINVLNAPAGMRCFDQEAASKSRKVVLPLVKDLLKSTSRREALQPNVVLVGVTGGIGSGKSTVSRRAEALGAAMVDCDKLGHLAYAVGTEGHAAVVKTFGSAVVAADGSIDRKALGAIVFTSTEKMRQLTDIVWPAIAKMVREKLRAVEKAAAEDKSGQIHPVVIEAAVLVKAGWHVMCDQVWVCAATEQVVVDRLVASRKMTPEEVRQRMAMQVDSRPYASRVFITEDTVEVLERKVDAAFAELVRPGSGGPDRSEL